MNIIVKISLRWHAIKDIFSALAPLMLIVLKIFFRLSKPYLFLSGSADLKEETHEEICLNKRKPRRGDETDIWGNWDIAKTWREQFSEKSGEARKLRGVRKSWKEIWDLGIWRNPPRRQMGLWNPPQADGTPAAEVSPDYAQSPPSLSSYYHIVSFHHHEDLLHHNHHYRDHHDHDHDHHHHGAGEMSRPGSTLIQPEPEQLYVPLGPPVIIINSYFSHLQSLQLYAVYAVCQSVQFYKFYKFY